MREREREVPLGFFDTQRQDKSNKQEDQTVETLKKKVSNNNY